MTRKSDDSGAGDLMDPLISPRDLLDRLSGFVACDVRWSLDDPAGGRALYEKGHIPGAVFVDLDRDLSASPGLDGRHPLPSPGDFASTLGRLGISQDDVVVAYDDKGGAVAARLWWMLRSIGHERAAVLDGGYQAWARGGHPTETGWTSPQPKTYPDPGAFQGVVELEEVSARTIVDARAPERYRGESEPVDPKAGHIPGAINLPTSGNLSADGTFLGEEALRERYAGIGEEAVMSCGSGVTACHNALSMVIAGYEMPDVYIGSFSEWSRRDMPVETTSAR